jgi:hypothetical protein
MKLPQLGADHLPAVLLTLLLASMTAFVLARFSVKLNLTLLGVSSRPTCCHRRPC